MMDTRPRPLWFPGEHPGLAAERAGASLAPDGVAAAAAAAGMAAGGYVFRDAPDPITECGVTDDPSPYAIPTLDTGSPMDFRAELDVAKVNAATHEATPDCNAWYETVLDLLGDPGFNHQARFATRAHHADPPPVFRDPVGPIAACEVPDGRPPIAPLHTIPGRTMTATVFPGVAAPAWADVGQIRTGSFDRDYRKTALELG
jgi:hypothetical protein